MPTFKNIRIKMKGGKSRTQRVKVLASGKYKFVKNLKGSTSSKSKSTPKSTKSKSKAGKGGKRMGKRKSIAQQAFKWIRIGALAAPAASIIVAPISNQEKIDRAIAWYTGFYPPTGEWKLEHLAKGWLPYIGAILTTYGIPKIASIIRRL